MNVSFCSTEFYRTDPVTIMVRVITIVLLKYHNFKRLLQSYRHISYRITIGRKLIFRTVSAKLKMSTNKRLRVVHLVCSMLTNQHIGSNRNWKSRRRLVALRMTKSNNLRFNFKRRVSAQTCGRVDYLSCKFNFFISEIMKWTTRCIEPYDFQTDKPLSTERLTCY